MIDRAHATFLILAHAADRGAANVARLLAARRGGHAVLLVSAAELARPARWTHTIDASGTVGGELALSSGRRVAADGVGCVLNRLSPVMPPAFVRADAREREFAAAELQALVASWLEGIGRPVFHAAGGSGSRAPTSRRQWLTEATLAGIPVARTVVATSTRSVRRDEGLAAHVIGPWPTAPASVAQPVEIEEPPDGALFDVFVAGERVYGSVGGALRGRCVELAARTGCALLALTFAGTYSEPRLHAVDPAPPLLDARSASATADLLERGCRG